MINHKTIIVVKLIATEASEATEGSRAKFYISIVNINS